MLATSTAAATQSQQLAPAIGRGLAVLSWGRNVEGQCGVETSLLVLRPTPIIELHDAAVQSLHAGKLHSGAVTAGEAWTWGDGKCGKLGHGSAEHTHTPSRVESLVGRAAVARLALGDHHTLFVDSQGGLWACGENKEGQCGLGTPVETIAAQHRKAYYESFRALRDTIAAEPRASRDQRGKQVLHALLGSGGQQHAAQHAGGGWGHGGGHGWGSGRSSGWQSLAAAGSAQGGGAGGVSHAGARAALNFGGLDFEGAFASAGLQPGQQATPLRIGRDQHPLMSALQAQAAGAAGAAAAGSLAAAAGLAGAENNLRMVLPSGLEGEVVVEVAASRYFSAALTAAGEVWCFGADYNGSLGSDNSWSTSAQKVSGRLAAALEEGGGAVRVVAGGTFCAALTASGRVVLWGKVPGGEAEAGALLGGGAGVDGSGGAEADGSLGRVLGLTEQGVDIVQGGRIIAGVVPNLPPITHIAAGQQHILLSDGERVWQIGRGYDASGTVVSTAPWRRPALVLTLPAGESVRQLTAGMHSSGVVSDAGAAWAWGRILDRHHADSVVRRHPHLAFGEGGGHVSPAGAAAAAAAAAGGGGGGAAGTLDGVGRHGAGAGVGAGMARHSAPPQLHEDVRWGWSGFGGREPARLDGLGGPVRALALGGWHALALVE
ncbi:hypothetical protein HYH02_007486 [Chlamydomonas schloesseri]|uniref:Uncharacterized protein n=1 Tax=Chlamydomonas schloesseri TaxID=2026947 RepID=A0A836B4R7_9CHLO|nr:hypothetical protein HYH02_007486 [Chlamydomonas schloesseri]|eukprot:KAG2447562.1 hypothetical protein HYH02_007486 [Chlamydomonas schloesseri]